MNHLQQQEDVDFLPSAPDLPSLVPSDNDEQFMSEEEIATLSTGFIFRAPMPMEQVTILETTAGAKDGTYFVELMRKRLIGLQSIQDKWLSRACNKKHTKHHETQMKIKEFMDAVLETYATQFGKQSSSMTKPPIRKHHNKKLRVL